jgi:hypothetical protein
MNRESFPPRRDDLSPLFLALTLALALLVVIPGRTRRARARVRNTDHCGG